MHTFWLKKREFPMLLVIGRIISNLIAEMCFMAYVVKQKFESKKFKCVFFWIFIMGTLPITESILSNYGRHQSVSRKRPRKYP